tara:strand:- start:4457 stop:5413 length:957 start_codon:yes stop_codon:yes gene_type:complete
MPANFTSGWFGNNEQAWHGLGTVTEGTLPAREAFETADALFTVEKRELSYPVWLDGDTHLPHIDQPTGTFGVVRADTQQFLGAVSDVYETVQNHSLLRMAEFIREEADMDSVVVLADGAKVAFTATLKGAATEIVEGDKLCRRIVGYLGHDGKTGCGAMFTDVRVVCSNTLAAAMGNNRGHASVRHTGGAEQNFDALIQSIDVARQSFEEDTEFLKACAATELPSFAEFIADTYGIRDLSKMRKYRQLNSAYHYGMGSRYASGSVWNAINAVTEVETSPKVSRLTYKQRLSKFNSANFGTGMQYAKKAVAVAKELVSV